MCFPLLGLVQLYLHPELPVSLVSRARGPAGLWGWDVGPPYHMGVCCPGWSPSVVLRPSRVTVILWKLLFGSAVDGVWEWVLIKWEIIFSKVLQSRAVSNSPVCLLGRNESHCFFNSLIFACRLLTGLCHPPARSVWEWLTVWFSSNLFS